MRGPDGKWVSRTALAAEYSEPFCKALLEACEWAAPLPRLSNRLDPDAGVRIGEASHPGPRQQSGVGPVDLREGLTPLVSEKYTARIRDISDWASLHCDPPLAVIMSGDALAANAFLSALLQDLDVRSAPLSRGRDGLAATMKRYPWLRGAQC